jgi:hypothetical protein
MAQMVLAMTIALSIIAVAVVMAAEQAAVLAVLA